MELLAEIKRQTDELKTSNTNLKVEILMARGRLRRLEEELEDLERPQLERIEELTHRLEVYTRTEYIKIDVRDLKTRVDDIFTRKQRWGRWSWLINQWFQTHLEQEFLYISDCIYFRNDDDAGIYSGGHKTRHYKNEVVFNCHAAGEIVKSNLTDDKKWSILNQMFHRFLM